VKISNFNVLITCSLYFTRRGRTGGGRGGGGEGRNFEDSLAHKERKALKQLTKNTKRRLPCRLGLFGFFNLLHFSKHQTYTNPFFGSQGDILDIVIIIKKKKLYGFLFHYRT